MFAWVIILSGLALSWNFTDLESDGVFYNTLCPIFVGIFLIWLLVKVVVMLGPGSASSGGSGGGGFFGGGGGGDGDDCGGE